VELSVPRDASADIRVDVGSGSIDCDVPGAEILAKEHGELHVRLGGGAADVVIDTGSGGVDIKTNEI